MKRYSEECSEGFVYLRWGGVIRINIVAIYLYLYYINDWFGMRI